MEWSGLWFWLSIVTTLAGLVLGLVFLSRRYRTLRRRRIDGPPRGVEPPAAAFDGDDAPADGDEAPASA
jgi:hypothetical protein